MSLPPVPESAGIARFAVTVAGRNLNYDTRVTFGDSDVTPKTLTMDRIVFDVPTGIGHGHVVDSVMVPRLARTQL
jgi:hypothetical protein